MKTLISFSVLIALLALGSVALAGPAPGQPGLGASVGELSRSRAQEQGSSAQPYALKGEADRGPRADCDKETSLSVRDRRRCDPTSVSHRRYPGGVH
jgi:hypothetical protein